MIHSLLRADPRVVLVPIEHLSARGLVDAGREALVASGWKAERVDLVDRGFALYWDRVASLAQRSPAWAPPRLRNLVIVVEADSVHPYAQILNTSSWTLFESDVDPETSNAEFLACLLAHGDRMALLGEVTRAGLFNAAYWFERTEAERQAIRVGAERALVADADLHREIVAASGWLGELYESSLRPPPSSAVTRPIPGSGLMAERFYLDLANGPSYTFGHARRSGQAARGRTRRRFFISLVRTGMRGGR